MQTLETQELRIGICSCTTTVHGNLNGLAVPVKQLEDTVFEKPIIFTLKEVVIPELWQREILKQLRCHFFLDFDEDIGSLLGVSLSGNDLITDSTGRVSLFRGGRGRMLSKRWSSRHPPTIEEILQAICGILMEFSEKKFQQWISRMTPPGWVVI